MLSSTLPMTLPEDEDFTITIDNSPYPQNNLACNAISIPANGQVQTGFNNTNANAFNNEQTIASAATDCVTSWCDDETIGGIAQINNSVWFTFVAPASGAVEVSTCGLASFDSQLAVYKATDCNNFSSYTLVGANDDGPATCATNFDSFVSINGLTVGATYYIMVDGYQAAAGDFGISITEVVPTSTDETVLETSLVEIFPNPNKGAFSVNLDGITAAAEMTITNITGQIFYHQTILPNIATVDVQLKEVPHGLYLMTIVNEKQRIIRKVVVE